MKQQQVNSKRIQGTVVENSLSPPTTLMFLQALQQKRAMKMLLEKNGKTSSPCLNVKQPGRKLKDLLFLFSRKLTVHSWDQSDEAIGRMNWHLRNEQSTKC